MLIWVMIILENEDNEVKRAAEEEGGVSPKCLEAVL